jgi:rod shape determining protein RodA
MMRKQFTNFDFLLLFLSLTIFCIGLLFLYSTTHSEGVTYERNLVVRQLVWMAGALFILVILASFDYQRYIDVSYILYAVSIILLILVLFIGRTKYGAQRWFSVGMFTFQPSEFAKPALILVLAAYIGSRRSEHMGMIAIIVCSVLTLVPMLLIAVEPDLGTSIVFLVILFSMLYVGGARLKYLLGIIGIGLLSTPFLWQMLRDYQKQRLLVFLNPNADPLGAGYTVIQSKIAIGSGSLLGKGWLSGTQNQLNFLPERHSDFIFSVVGEEWGFLGSMVVVALYFALILRAFSIISRTSDSYGKLIVTGVVSMLTFQIVVNIAMTLGFMPVVGLPLPLISYGGSSLITAMSSIALVINVGMGRSRL